MVSHSSYSIGEWFGVKPGDGDGRRLGFGEPNGWFLIARIALVSGLELNVGRERGGGVGGRRDREREERGNRERERERERAGGGTEREREIEETDRQSDRQTDRDIERLTETERHMAWRRDKG